MLRFSYKLPKRELMNYLKRLSFILILFCIGVNANSMSFVNANASSFIDTDTFIHLHYNDQIKIIEEAQIMAAKMEEIQNQDLKKEIYHTYIKTLVNLLINQAYAQNLEGNAKLCIYAGWVSIIVKRGGNSVCTHPYNLKGSEVDGITNPTLKHLVERSKAGLKKYKNTKCQVNQMQLCSPDLYGLNPETDQPFCVVGNKDSYNSSFECLKQVEKFNDKPEAKKKIFDGIINKVTDSSNENNIDLINMFKVYYDICLCEGSNNFINKDYAKKMYNQRTCYSWLRQTDNIMSNFKQREGVCVDLVSKQDGEQAYSLLKWLNTAQDNIKSVIKNDSKNAKEYFDNIDSRANKDADAYWIEMRNTGKVSACPLTILPGSTENPETPIDPNNLKCAIAPIKDKTKDSSTTKENNPEEPKDKPQEKNKDPAKDKKESAEEKEIKPALVELSIDLKKEEYKAIDINWSGAKQLDEKDSFKASYDDQAKEVNISAKVLVTLNDDSKKEYSCTYSPIKEDKVPDNNKDEKDFENYSIEAEVKKDTDKTSILIAKVTFDGEEITDLEAEGLKVIWKIKSIPDPKKKAKKEKADEDTGLNEEDDGVIEKDDKKEDPKSKELDEGLEVEAPKTKSNQTATACLTKEDEEDKCDDVDVNKLKEKKVAPNKNGSGPQRNQIAPPNLIKDNNRGLRGVK